MSSEEDEPSPATQQRLAARLKALNFDLHEQRKQKESLLDEKRKRREALQDFILSVRRRRELSVSRGTVAASTEPKKRRKTPSQKPLNYLKKHEPFDLKVLQKKAYESLWRAKRSRRRMERVTRMNEIKKRRDKLLRVVHGLEEEKLAKEILRKESIQGGEKSPSIHVIDRLIERIRRKMAKIWRLIDILDVKSNEKSRRLHNDTESTPLSVRKMKVRQRQRPLEEESTVDVVDDGITDDDHVDEDDVDEDDVDEVVVDEDDVDASDDDSLEDAIQQDSVVVCVTDVQPERNTKEPEKVPEVFTPVKEKTQYDDDSVSPSCTATSSPEEKRIDVMLILLEKSKENKGSLSVTKKVKGPLRGEMAHVLNLKNSYLIEVEIHDPDGVFIEALTFEKVELCNFQLHAHYGEHLVVDCGHDADFSSRKLSTRLVDRETDGVVSRTRVQDLWFPGKNLESTNVGQYWTALFRCKLKAGSVERVVARPVHFECSGETGGCCGCGKK